MREESSIPITNKLLDIHNISRFNNIHEICQRPLSPLQWGTIIIGTCTDLTITQSFWKGISKTLQRSTSTLIVQQIITIRLAN